MTWITDQIIIAAEAPVNMIDIRAPTLACWQAKTTIFETAKINPPILHAGLLDENLVFSVKFRTSREVAMTYANHHG